MKFRPGKFRPGKFRHGVCVVGTGRVGLPLALSFIDVGLDVVGVEIDPVVREAITDGRMPWREPGYDALIASRRLTVSDDPALATEAAAVVITVGTPLHRHIESDLRQIQRVLESIAPHLREGQLIVLRSTVAPGTTSWAARWLARETGFTIGEELTLAFCPERIAEGRAFAELRTLPQICGTADEASRVRAGELFADLAPSVQHTDYTSAELVKLFTNMVRYVNFAVANQLTLVAEDLGANIYEIRRLANLDYPREHLPMPGLTAGPCLRKDFGMINEWSPYPDLFLAAWKLNEHIPAFLVRRLLERTELHDRRVALLGFAFKADTDDIRDSLSPKLYRYIQRELPADVRVSDHHLAAVIEDPELGDVVNHPVDEALADVDVVFVAVPHSGYSDVIARLAETRPEAWVVDLWNVGGRDRITYRAAGE